MSINLSGRRALVTGATSGIGLGIAHALANKGANAVLSGIDAESEAKALLDEFKSKYPKGDFRYIPCNLQDPQNTEKLGKDVLALYPDGVDILINSAGIPGRAILEDLTLQHWQDTLAVNLTAPFLLTKAFFPSMKAKRWGRIINISSVNGIISDPGKAAYGSTKSGLLGLSRVTALEGAEFGITCNPICPSMTDAPMGNSILLKLAETKGTSYEEEKAHFLENVNPPTKRIIAVSEVAELVAFLCSDHAVSITGSPIPIDGGHVIR